MGKRFHRPLSKEAILALGLFVLVAEQAACYCSQLHSPVIFPGFEGVLKQYSASFGMKFQPCKCPMLSTRTRPFRRGGVFIASAAPEDGSSKDTKAGNSLQVCGLWELIFMAAHMMKTSIMQEIRMHTDTVWNHACILHRITHKILHKTTLIVVQLSARMHCIKVRRGAHSKEQLVVRQRGNKIYFISIHKRDWYIISCGKCYFRWETPAFIIYHESLRKPLICRKTCVNAQTAFFSLRENDAEPSGAGKWNIQIHRKIQPWAQLQNCRYAIRTLQRARAGFALFELVYPRSLHCHSAFMKALAPPQAFCARACTDLLAVSSKQCACTRRFPLQLKSDHDNDWWFAAAIGAPGAILIFMCMPAIQVLSYTVLFTCHLGHGHSNISTQWGTYVSLFIHILFLGGGGHSVVSLALRKSNFYHATHTLVINGILVHIHMHTNMNSNINAVMNINPNTSMHADMHVHTLTLTLTLDLFQHTLWHT